MSSFRSSRSSELPFSLTKLHRVNKRRRVASFRQPERDDEFFLAGKTVIVHQFACFDIFRFAPDIAFAAFTAEFRYGFDEEVARRQFFPLEFFFDDPRDIFASEADERQGLLGRRLACASVPDVALVGVDIEFELLQRDEFERASEVARIPIECVSHGRFLVAVGGEDEVECGFEIFVHECFADG